MARFSAIYITCSSSGFSRATHPLSGFGILGRFAFFPAFSAFWPLFLVYTNAVVAAIAPMTSFQ
jgi:hypothetical protein